MHSADYYRDQASRARRLGESLSGSDQHALETLARDFDDIAEDLDRGAIEIRHPELMPQTGRMR